MVDGVEAVGHARLRAAAGGEVWDARLGRAPAIVKRAPDVAGREAIAAEAAALRAAGGPPAARLLGEDRARGALVRERIDGPPLPEWAAAAAPAAVLEAFGALADGLDRWAQAGLHHGDLSPGNVHPDAAGALRILDFGPPGRGTAGFAAPERDAGAAPDPASDAFSLGALLFFALTGGMPWGTDPAGAACGPATRWPWVPGMIRAGVPAAADALLRALLHRDPARRAPLRGLGAALRAAAAGPLGPPPDPRVVAAWGTLGALGLEAVDRGLGAVVALRPGLPLDAVAAQMAAAFAADGAAEALVVVDPEDALDARAPGRIVLVKAGRLRPEWLSAGVLVLGQPAD